MADLFIDSALILTMTGKGAGVISNGSIAVNEGKIVAVGKADEMKDFRARAHRVIDGSNYAVLPGLIDGHIHTGLGLLRGLSQDIDHWMRLGLGPWTRHMDSNHIRAGSMVNAIEAVKAGTTTLLDYGSNMDQTARFYEQLGVRAKIAEVITEVKGGVGEHGAGDLYEFSPDQGQYLLDKTEALIHQWHEGANGRITCMYGPQASDMVSMELIKEIKHRATQKQLMIHMHVAQGDRETEQMKMRYGDTTIPVLDREGIIDQHLLAVHLTDATAEQAALLADRGAFMACCPGSIAIIDGIVTPLVPFLQAGGAACLGSDQVCGNNCSNMWNEMKLVCLLNKVHYQDPKVMPAYKALQLATCIGARAVGLGNDIGTIEAGKYADLIVVDLMDPGLTPRIEHPVRNVVANLVYSARGSEIAFVIINGQVVVERGTVLTVDERSIVEQAHAAGRELSERVTIDEPSQLQQWTEACLI